jgi:CheY-like chemotaxis protein
MTEARRILVIDDEPDFADLVVKVAANMGYTATAARNAMNFQKLYLAAPPDVIVLDIVMPDQDGIELIQWLVSHGCDARIVIASGNNPDYARTAKILGEVSGKLDVTILRKPVKLEDLRASLR